MVAGNLHPYVLDVEEHSVIGGLGDAVIAALAGSPVPVCKVGMQDVSGESGPAEALLTKYGLDATGIAASVRSFVRGE